MVGSSEKSAGASPKRFVASTSAPASPSSSTTLYSSKATAKCSAVSPSSSPASIATLCSISWDTMSVQPFDAAAWSGVAPRSSGAFRFPPSSTIAATCAASAARFRSTSITLGGQLSRNHVHTVLAGEAVDSTLNGLYIEDGSQHVDNHTLIEHAKPHCQSHEFYKGILGGKSSGVFRGKIHVHQAAQKTDAYQTNRNLILGSDDAMAVSLPRLEIAADDVKCSHGSTTGQVDEVEMFYLMSRGIPRAEAEKLVVFGFFGEVTSRIPLQGVRQKLDRAIEDKIGLGFGEAMS